MKRLPRKPPRRRVSVRGKALQGAAPPYTGRPSPWRNPFLRFGLLLLGALVVAALVADLTGRLSGRPVPPDDPAALVLGLDDRHYEDPAGRFRITVPAAWLLVTGAEAAPYAAVFRGPRDVEVYVRVSPAAHARFPLLVREVRRIEADWGINMNIRTNTFDGLPSVERDIRLVAQKLRVVDFLVGRTAHHLQFAAPRDDFDRYTGLFDAILESYEPLRPPAAGGDAAP